MEQINGMKADAAAGRLHPMQAKKDLAARIVTDFHGAEAGVKASADWARQFQRDEAPEALETVTVSYQEVAAKSADGAAVKLDKVLARAGMADSATDAQRKLKAKAVKVEGEVKVEPVLAVTLPAEFTVRVGRLMKRVVIQ